MFWSRKQQDAIVVLEADKKTNILNEILTGCVALGKLQYFSLPQLTRWKNRITASNSTYIDERNQSIIYCVYLIKIKSKCS